MTQSTAPVLLAYDGSESSATAIAVAGRLLPGREALVCHVGSDDLGREERTAAAGGQLAEVAGFSAKPLPVHDERHPWRALLQVAEQHHASLIVAGAHGTSGVRRALLGSVSTGLVHHSRLPVLVVPTSADRNDTNGPLLLCYDGSDSAKRAIAMAGELFDPQPAIVFHFWESWIAEAPALASLSRAVEGMATELDEIGEDLSSKVTGDGVELAEQAGFDATGLSERAVGPGWMAVREAANRHECAAIVIGSRGLTGVSAALGSVSNGCVHNSHRPVLVVPSEEDE
jgi:nucleotide-binding universal stress UspA family protein